MESGAPKIACGKDLLRHVQTAGVPADLHRRPCVRVRGGRGQAGARGQDPLSTHVWVFGSGARGGEGAGAQGLGLGLRAQSPVPRARGRGPGPRGVTRSPQDPGHGAMATPGSSSDAPPPQPLPPQRVVLDTSSGLVVAAAVETAAVHEDLPNVEDIPPMTIGISPPL